MVDFFEESWSHASGPGRVRLVARALRDSVVHGAFERVGWNRKGSPGRWTMGGWVLDLRFALRGLRRRPGFLAAVVAIMTLGIGTASGVFAVVDAVVLRPLPYPESDRLVAMWTEFEDFGDVRFGLSLAEHHDYAEETRAFGIMGAFTAGLTTLAGDGEARRVSAAWTWGDLFEVIGARTSLGRLPSAEDTHTGSAPVAVISHAFWVSALGSDPNVLGRTLELSGGSVEVVGVMDASVRLPTAEPSIWLPIAQDRGDITDRSGHSLDVIARLAPGADIGTVRDEIERVHARWNEVWAAAHSPGHTGHAFAAAPLHDRYFGHLRSAAVLLLASTGLVLVLACANVASLLLARSEARASELALRRALGAGRGRIARQLLVESLVISALGGALGLALASFGGAALMGLDPGDVPRVDTIGLDPRVTLFAIVAILGSGLLVGVLPALRAGASPGNGARGGAGPDRSLSRSLSTLVAVQVGLATVLLAGAGLLGRSVLELAAADTGIESEGRLTFRVSTTSEQYPTMVDVDGFWTRLLSDVAALPGVERAAAIRLLPLRDGLRQEMIRIPDRTRGDPAEAETVAYQMVTPGYFETMGIDVVDGRAFGTTDVAGAPRVGLVNETAARAYWPDGSPVGERVLPAFWGPEIGDVTIVGVLADVRPEGARTVTGPELYMPYAQTPEMGRGYARHGVVVVRTLGEPGALVAPIRGVVQAIDPRIPVSDVSTLEEVEAGGRARERFLATVLGVFGLLSLAMAGMGTYGVVAYAAARRTREFGVRIALGARRGQVVGDVVRRGAVLAAVGTALGVVGALLGGPLLEGFLFGVDARDPALLAAGPILMGAIVLVASAVPALRASQVDPMEAFREEV
jgi:predicted permease